ncbi:MAG TPA: HD domain-containing protein [Oligoflexia bacterium]|nr:HD domain-containing protein [Oligoflexia bacterium]HMP49351.1 HD domain-containing protein [Oligoflexia bacterium]
MNYATSDTLQGSRTVNFADVAHGTLIFDRKHPVDALVLKLIDTAWVQRLRRISQTGNTRLVYMFAEHSRFGHSLGVGYLASLLMKHLSQQVPDQIEKYQLAIGAAAILHDIGHLAPGSHLAENVWSRDRSSFLSHEALSRKIISEDHEIRGILDEESTGLADLVLRILDEDRTLPSWTTALISGGGWNVDRGNWSIVDSVMCAVSYGRYNVTALIDAFRISNEGELVIQESRLDALTHFFVARNSMYRQVYQHRVLQSADALSRLIVRRLRELGNEASTSIFMDSVMKKMLFSDNYQEELGLSELYQVCESWWEYHLLYWRSSSDKVLADLSSRLIDRKLFKTIHLPLDAKGELNERSREIVRLASETAISLGYPPEYYTILIGEKDRHRAKQEQLPRVLEESGKITPVDKVEPLLELLTEKSKTPRAWIAVPAEVKNALGLIR